ncbi:hypothetical protein EGW08_001218 [Elysia chlorotica]|uniref:Uncharacterized protein n=1 Tax=Elysia chlorotica TaxID=188477 RepID=A0A433UB08_ELYCH|nr:hypothetical protein EGW08_001218 [Elysia chlorotica]
MAYLPPAGVRHLTSDKISHIPTMLEIPAPHAREKFNSRKKVTSAVEIPPLKNRDADWPPPAKYFYPKFPLYEDGCSARCQCVRPSVPLGENGRHMGQDCGAREQRELPYGLPPVTCDCKKRVDWLGEWSEHMARYSGAFALLERQIADTSDRR